MSIIKGKVTIPPTKEQLDEANIMWTPQNDKLRGNISIKKISITKLKTDAVVNAANQYLAEGGGVCGFIFHDAGSADMTAACNKYGHCDIGSAVITPGFKLPAKFVIHAVGPIWKGGTQQEPALLYNAYMKSLELAKANDLHSIGFPLISAGIFGYPIDQAWKAAFSACKDFMVHNDYTIDIIFAVLDDQIMMVGQKVLKSMYLEKTDVNRSYSV